MLALPAGTDPFIIDDDADLARYSPDAQVDHSYNYLLLMGADYYRWEDPAHRNRVEGPRHPGIDEDTVVEHAIIDKSASIGRGCTITNAAGVQEGEGPGFYIRDGIVVVLKNAEIPDGTVI